MSAGWNEGWGKVLAIEKIPCAHREIPHIVCALYTRTWRVSLHNKRLQGRPSQTRAQAQAGHFMLVHGSDYTWKWEKWEKHTRAYTSPRLASPQRTTRRVWVCVARGKLRVMPSASQSLLLLAAKWAFCAGQWQRCASEMAVWAHLRATNFP